MTGPVSGPFYERKIYLGQPNMYGYRPNWVERTRRWYRQMKPYDLPLQYNFNDYRVADFMATDGTDTSGYESGNNGFNTSLKQEAFNRAYSRFLSGDDRSPGVMQTAELSTTLAERRQAMDMMTSRLQQLTRFTRSLRRLDFAGAAKALNLTSKTRPRGLKANAKAFGNNFLEFHFGWEPLVKDIGNAVEVLQGGVAPMYVSARGKSPRLSWTEWYSHPTWNPNGTQASASWYADFWEECKCEIASQMAVTNPDLWLANQLGFVNPAKVLWEVVPFSFVVDWFVNVSDFLSGYSGFLGLSLLNPRTTYLQHSGKTEQYQFNARVKSTVWTAVDLERVLGIAQPTLRVRQPRAISPVRGLTAISLLLQQLR